MSFVDKTKICSSCERPFTFTAGEQEFFHMKGFSTEPRSCAGCRSARKGAASRDTGAPPRQFTGICASCGNQAQLPFVPREGRPVYCGDCFQPQAKNANHDLGGFRTRYGAFRDPKGRAQAPQGTRSGSPRAGERRPDPRGKPNFGKARGWR